jgi:hypothetical protein
MHDNYELDQCYGSIVPGMISLYSISRGCVLLEKVASPPYCPSVQYSYTALNPVVVGVVSCLQKSVCWKYDAQIVTFKCLIECLASERMVVSTIIIIIIIVKEALAVLALCRFLPAKVMIVT